MVSSRLYGIPLLSREREKELFRKYNYIKYLAAMLQENIRRDVVAFAEDLRGEIDVMLGALHYLPAIRRKAPEAEIEALRIGLAVPGARPAF